MNSIRPIRSTRYGLLSLGLIVAVGGGFGFKAAREKIIKESSINYALSYPKTPKGWVDMPHGPQTLFLYQDPKSKILLSGSINQMIEEFNPTPDLKTDELAEQMIYITHRNMPGWTAESLDSVAGHDMRFRIIKRAQKNQVVVTAFSVRGNTTVLISFSARDSHLAELEKKMDEFRSFLENCSLSVTDLSKL